MDEKTLKKLKRIYDQADSFGKELMEKEFPEVFDSEDEKIRKEIKRMITYFYGSNLNYEHLVAEEDMIDWLEKQEEKKPIEEANGENYGIEDLSIALDILQKTCGKVDGYQTDDGILEHQCAISAVKELSKQKPAEWSEEDEETIKDACVYLNKYGNLFYGKNDDKAAEVYKTADNLKSFKKRME